MSGIGPAATAAATGAIQLNFSETDYPTALAKIRASIHQSGDKPGVLTLDLPAYGISLFVWSAWSTKGAPMSLYLVGFKNMGGTYLLDVKDDKSGKTMSDFLGTSAYAAIFGKPTVFSRLTGTYASFGFAVSALPTPTDASDLKRACNALAQHKGATYGEAGPKNDLTTGWARLAIAVSEALRFSAVESLMVDVLGFKRIDSQDAFLVSELVHCWSANGFLLPDPTPLKRTSKWR